MQPQTNLSCCSATKEMYTRDFIQLNLLNVFSLVNQEKNRLCEGHLKDILKVVHVLRDLFACQEKKQISASVILASFSTTTWDPHLV